MRTLAAIARPHDHATRILWTLLALTLLLAVAPARAADRTAWPAALDHEVLPAQQVRLHQAERVDPEVARAEDLVREDMGLPPRFAVPQPVFIAPDNQGTWENLDQSTRLWRLRIRSEGALSINLGFTRYALPPGAELRLYPFDGSQPAIAFTDADNKAHGELWTPIIETDDLMVEVEIAAKAVDELDLELTSVNVGYRPLSELFDKSGTCNIDVVCPEGDDWRDDINTVAVISSGGSTNCTGFMINNTADDETPYFVTAYHCGVRTANAPSLVAYWNYQSPICGAQTGGSLTQFNTGSTLRAEYSVSDFTLVELDELPDPAWNVAYAGWDHSGIEAQSAVAIHHPSVDEKSISFENDPTSTTTYLGTAVPGDGTHVRITDWDLGTTEGGSSGSPLFDQDHRVIGQLHGGYAACGNDESDWYGRWSVSWNGGGAATSRLRDWLDPLATGQTVLDLLAPYATGMRVSGGGLTAEGDVGGPFTPASAQFTLENSGTTPLDYLVSADVAWLDLTAASGTLAAGASVVVTASFNTNANSLTTGLYAGLISFTNTTDGDGNTNRPVSLQVGVPSIVYAFPMDVDPLWTTEGDWAFGVPAGAGGQYGNTDPSAGFDGPNVYGYNLAGDYANSLPERHLTSGALNCTDLTAVTLKFRRWLNVERPAYDHAYLRVSSDGVNWVTVWENAAEVTDSGWTAVEYDLSALADGQATVYLRWTMGTTDGSWQYSGWNLDNVEIWALEQATNTGSGQTPVPAARLLPVVPNPFNPRTEASFDLTRAAEVRLAVFDTRGHLVKTLESGPFEAGHHVVAWDGTDAAGRALGSGAYFFRLEADGLVDVQKAVLVR
jgi:hypothetical protein